MARAHVGGFNAAALDDESFSNEESIFFTREELIELGLPKMPKSGVKIVLDALIDVVDHGEGDKREHRQLVFTYKNENWGVVYYKAPGHSKRKVEPWDEGEIEATRYNVIVRPAGLSTFDKSATTKPPAESRRRRPKTKAALRSQVDAAA